MYNLISYLKLFTKILLNIIHFTVLYFNTTKIIIIDFIFYLNPSCISEKFAYQIIKL